MPETSSTKTPPANAGTLAAQSSSLSEDAWGLGCLALLLLIFVLPPYLWYQANSADKWSITLTKANTGIASLGLIGEMDGKSLRWSAHRYYQGCPITASCVLVTFHGSYTHGFDVRNIRATWRVIWGLGVAGDWNLTPADTSARAFFVTQQQPHIPDP